MNLSGRKAHSKEEVSRACPESSELNSSLNSDGLNSDGRGISTDAAIPGRILHEGLDPDRFGFWVSAGLPEYTLVIGGSLRCRVESKHI